jgi:hypothetical protein
MAGVIRQGVPRDHQPDPRRESPTESLDGGPDFAAVVSDVYPDDPTAKEKGAAHRDDDVAPKDLAGELLCHE